MVKFPAKNLVFLLRSQQSLVLDEVQMKWFGSKLYRDALK